MSSLDGRHPNIPEVAEPDYACASSNGGRGAASGRPSLVKQEISVFADSVSSEYSADSQTADYYRSLSTSDSSDTDHPGKDESELLLAVSPVGEQADVSSPGVMEAHGRVHLDEDSRAVLLQPEVLKPRATF